MNKSSAFVDVSQHMIITNEYFIKLGPRDSGEVLVECLTCVFCCLSEGVQLLCLIDKAADACRYLQTYGEWNRAAWLAKVTQHDAVHQQETSRSFCECWKRSN